MRRFGRPMRPLELPKGLARTVMRRFGRPMRPLELPKGRARTAGRLPVRGRGKNKERTRAAAAWNQDKIEKKEFLVFPLEYS